MKMIYVSHPYTGNEVENVEDTANKNRGKPARFYAYQFFMA